MLPQGPTPQDTAAIFDGLRQDFDIRAVAYGGRQKRIGKDQRVRINYADPVIAFFVPEKLPLAPDGATLVDGNAALPSTVTIGDQTLGTDVVVIASPAPTATGVMTQAPAFVPGGVLKGDNGKGFGTMACLVRDRTTQRSMALTNRHIAPKPGGFGYFYRSTGGPWFLKRPVTRVVENAQFGALLGLSGPAGKIIRVDASLIDIDPALLPQFSNQMPNLGELGAPFKPDLSSLGAYHQSLFGRNVYAYGWKTKVRKGEITHTFPALEQQAGKTVVGCFLISATTSSPPSEGGDSGKLWLTTDVTQNMPIGLNLGSTFDPTVAVATDFSALSEFLNFSVL